MSDGVDSAMDRPPPFDARRLAGWLADQGLIASAGAPLAVTPLGGGQSNPTFVVATGSRSSLHHPRYVLRKQPDGMLLPGAHAVDREYRVMCALQGTDVPVPRMHAYCDDASVVGTPFFIMQWLDGRVLVDQTLPGIAPDDRAAIYADMNRVMVALHAIDPGAVGLDGFGRPGNYFERQIARWSKQCLASSLPMGESMRRLIDWLPAHIPAGDETSVVHGDFRLDNVVLHPVEPRIIGVLDWELSTLGHPLADFAYHCMGWHIPASLWRGIAGVDLRGTGIPSEAEYIDAYARATGRDPSAHWDFYLAYNLFRMAAILRGIGQRVADGTATAPDARETAAKADPLADIGWACAQGRLKGSPR